MDGQSCQPLRNPYLTPYPKLNTTSTLKWRTPGCRQDLSNPDPPLSPSPLPWLPGPRGGQPPAGQPRRRGGSACRCPYNSSIGESWRRPPPPGMQELSAPRWRCKPQLLLPSAAASPPCERSAPHSRRRPEPGRGTGRPSCSPTRGGGGDQRGQGRRAAAHAVVVLVLVALGGAGI